MKTETFSYMPPFTNEQIAKQIKYFLKNGWIVGIEYSGKPGPKLAFWNWWKLPMFGKPSAEDVLAEIEMCQKSNPENFIRITSYDSMRQGQVMSFVVQRPM
jgi:ribulose-bisphosphate carboxylase small chain